MNLDALVMTPPMNDVTGSITDLVNACVIDDLCCGPAVAAAADEDDEEDEEQDETIGGRAEVSI